MAVKKRTRPVHCDCSGCEGRPVNGSGLLRASCMVTVVKGQKDMREISALEPLQLCEILQRQSERWLLLMDLAWHTFS